MLTFVLRKKTTCADAGVEDIGEDVEWKEPDVLASEVEWDDEIELLD